MTERPILFQGAMVRATLDGSKTQTRRICKPAQFYTLSRVVEVPDPQERGQVYNGSHFGDEDGEVQFASPYGGRCDRLWVRETWGYIDPDCTGEDYAVDGGPGLHCAPELCQQGHPLRDFWRRRVAYRASWEAARYGNGPDAPNRWRPSIHMPRWASRITLEIVDVRVERLQDISEADAKAEGVHLQPGIQLVRYCNPNSGCAHFTARDAYLELWEQINGPASAAQNPWVWVVEFRRLP